MGIGGIGARSQVGIQSLVDMRRQLDDLQRQLGTGKKSTTYAGLGIDRGWSVGLRGQLSGLDGFGQTMTLVGVRLDLSQSVLSRMMDLRADAKASLTQSAEIKADGQSAAQQSARGQLDELLDLLNTQVGDRYVFAGRNVDAPPVEPASVVLDGDGTRAGLKQIIAERALADIGASGLGRLTVGAAGATVTLAEDAAPSAFGFKLQAASSNLTGATVTGPSGSPPAIGVSFAANPNAGEQITLTLNLPDGTQENVTLKATTAAPAPSGEFTIGAAPAATAANLQSALSGALGARAKTSLAAASAMAAAKDFFDIGPGDPPLRVAGPPFDSATALVAGTATNTVSWYKGEMAADAPRSAAAARIDASITVNYGMRASEEGIRTLVQNVAAFAAVSFTPGDADTPARYEEMLSRVRPALAGASGGQSIEDIASDLAVAQSTIAATKERHQQTGHVLSGLLEEIEGVPMEEVAAQILSLQTRLQASLQVTSIVYQTRLTDYL